MSEVNSKSRLKRLALQQGRREPGIVRDGRSSQPEDIPLVFLDFDGVLNNMGSATAFGSFHTFDPVSVRLMARLCEETGAKIVVSSSWRPQAPGQLDLLLGSMREVGAGELCKFVIDYTQSLTGIRGAEIAKWRRDNKHNGNYVIFDDDSDMFPGQPLVQTSLGRGFGLCGDVRALQILSPGHPDINGLREHVGMKLGGQRGAAGWY